MTDPDQTSWTLIRRAADGDAPSRQDFAERFTPLVRRQLERRWRGTPLLADLEDATQDVLVACLEDGGVLGRAAASPPPSFHGYLFGVVRNIARGFEKRRVRVRETHDGGDAVEATASPATTLGRMHDRAAAREVLRRAAARHLELARTEGDGALRRCEILRLRFEEGLEVRAIAERWGEDPAKVHQEYRRARREFRRSLDREMLAAGRDPGRAWHDLMLALGG
jgi:RNA polymerase sigma-70 factor (ECF subfamily)